MKYKPISYIEDDLYYDECGTPHLEVTDEGSDYVFSGLYDANGIPLYHVKPTIGFIK